MYASENLDDYVRRLRQGLLRLIPAESMTVNWLDRQQRTITWVVEPAQDLFPGAQETFLHHLHDHPFIAYEAEFRARGACRWSDFVTQPQLHDTGLYQEFFRHVEVDYQLGSQLLAPGCSVLAIMFQRTQADFSERDRLVLTLLRPHLIRAYQNAEAFERLGALEALTDEWVHETARGVVVLSTDGRILRMNRPALRLMREYCGEPSGATGRLPEPLPAWLREHHSPLGAGNRAPHPRAPLVVDGPNGRLLVRTIARSQGRLLLLDEAKTVVSPGEPPWGLTRREAEVMRWVMDGKTNPEIGLILAASRRTVGKHLERILDKLGVPTRSAAAVKAAQHPFFQSG